MALPAPRVPAPLVMVLSIALAPVLPSCERRGAAGSAVAGERASAPAPLIAEESSIDFGSVFEGSVLEHEFELSARTPLAVTASKTDCGCTVALLECERGAERATYELGSRLDAGDRLFVGVRYDTTGKRGASHRAVTLTTDAGAPVSLSLAAVVEPWLVFEPAELEGVRLLDGQTAERSFRVSSAGGERFGLRATRRALPEAVRVEILPEDADGAGRASAWRGTVGIGTDAPRGMHSYPIELESDVAVPIRGATAGAEPRHFKVAPAWSVEVLGPVALSAPSLEFGLVDGRQTVARSVRLQSFDAGFAPAEPTARLEALRPGEPLPLGTTASIRVRPVEGLPAYDIEVTLAGLPPEVAGTFLARLVVETGHPDLPKLEALVRGVRAPSGSPGR